MSEFISSHVKNRKGHFGLWLPEMIFCQSLAWDFVLWGKHSFQGRSLQWRMPVLPFPLGKSAQMFSVGFLQPLAYLHSHSCSPSPEWVSLKPRWGKSSHLSSLFFGTPSSKAQQPYFPRYPGERGPRFAFFRQVRSHHLSLLTFRSWESCKAAAPSSSGQVDRSCAALGPFTGRTDNSRSRHQENHCSHGSQSWTFMSTVYHQKYFR